MSTKKSAFDFIVLGGGGRGNLFSTWIHEHPDVGRVVAVAEPDAGKRARIAERHGIARDRQFERWEDALAIPKFADAVINTTMDRLHCPAALAALGKGYHMLLEKPMATSIDDCVAIDQARRASGRIVSVCHTMRYSPAYAEVKRMLDSGAIGRLVSFDQVEGVGAVHQSHSFVRGNWGNTGRSTFMLLAKSCHDIDILSWLVGKPCRRVTSFGELSHFNQANAPAGAPARCTDGCPHEATCTYAAQKIYLGDDLGWAEHAGVRGTRVERIEALKSSPYGRCVYRCDNDVVDHQVVAMDFEGGVSGTFTMTAFAPGNRDLRLHGTEAALYLDLEANRIEIFRFRDNARQVIDIPPQSGSHGGLDNNIMVNFVHALRTDSAAAVLTGTAESLESHRIVFAAETSRKEKRMVELTPVSAQARADSR
ncbi:MAG: Gfo/Idh/MocA family oxidoreductase [Planctomycetes bacterium]|nr:Gfo/Idh/MocA family oxidoreductase [Planctomycetota bacterium]